MSVSERRVFFFIAVAICIVVIALTNQVFGVIHAFRHSGGEGIVALFIPPVGMAYGICYWFGLYPADMTLGEFFGT